MKAYYEITIKIFDTDNGDNTQYIGDRGVTVFVVDDIYGEDEMILDCNTYEDARKGIMQEDKDNKYLAMARTALEQLQEKIKK